MLQVRSKTLVCWAGVKMHARSSFVTCAWFKTDVVYKVGHVELCACVQHLFDSLFIRIVHLILLTILVGSAKHRQTDEEGPG